jgi:anti-sigma factor RsiW
MVRIDMDEDLHQLSALYVLDVLDGQDRARFEKHLEGCDRCQGELAGLRRASSALAFVETAPAPSPGLRERILADARAERQNVVPLRPRRSVAVSVTATLAVAATAAAVALGIWAATLNHSLNSERSASRVLKDPLARHVALHGAPGELVVAPSGDAVLTVALTRPPKGSTYEAWVAAPDAHRAGEFTGGTMKLDRPVPAGARVMVTLERAGGVDAPTQSPLLTANA